MAITPEAGYLGGGTGGGATSGVQAPPKTAEQLAEEEYQRNQRALERSGVLAAQGRANRGYTALPPNTPEEQAVYNRAHAGGNYGTGKPWYESGLPIVGDIPVAGPLLNTAVASGGGAVTEGLKEAYHHPMRTLATGGLNVGVAAGDKFVDQAASGISKQLGGGEVNLPLTPAQVWEPNRPVYTSPGGQEYNLPGLKDIGGAIGDAANTVGGALGGLGGVGGAGGGYTPMMNLPDQVNYARQRGIDAEQAGQSAMGAQQQVAGGFQQQAANFNPQAQSIAGQFGTGQRVNYSQQPGVQNVDPNSIGSIAGALGGGPGNVAGALGGGPANVAGRLGGAPTIANVGNVSGRLGAAPQVGQVGNIQMGAGPGNIAGLLSTMGQDNGGQAAMMGRLEGFLDQAPGPSIAEAQLQQSQADNMAALIGAARSGRGGAGAQAQALRQAQSEGSAIMSDTAGQLATLRAQEEDMRRNRQLQAIGLGGDLSTSMRGQDLQFRGQDLSALQSDQATQLGTRGQDLQGAMANQQTQTALEQLRGNLGIQARGQDLQGLLGDQATQAQLATARGQLALGARGQDLSALQGDQSTALGVRGQDLSALQGDQATALGARGQNLGALTADAANRLSALQGNQATALGARGQNIQQQVGLEGINAQLRGQDLSALTGDADRALAAQQLGLEGQLGFGNLANTARGQGLDFLGQMTGYGVDSERIAQEAINAANRNQTALQTAAMGQPNLSQMLLGEGINIAGLGLQDLLGIGD